ncbi:MAG: Bax inhibitor-1/YccA family protein [Chloroflexi bacterium]|nr:Bax inhibitor-1/YccA family protein [Chloroflexota bacterium]
MSYDTFSWSRVGAEWNSLVARVYAWMFLGLLATAVVAMTVASSPVLADAILGNTIVFFGLLIGELVLVIALAALVQRMSPELATLVFVGYAVLNGVTFSMIFLAFTATSIATTFFITAGTFGVMSVYGYVTQRDLTSIGNLLLMGLVGVILASVVNIFLANSIIYWITGVAGILIFVGLTAYDTQKIKRMSATIDATTGAGQKAAILGALALYLDFVNLFLLLLRFTGQRQ